MCARPAKQRPPAADTPETNWRLFLAVPLPPEVRAVVAAQVAELAKRPWPVRWVSPDSAHLTLHFLGETPPERAELLRLALPPVVASESRFRLRTAGLGVFPNQRRPRVLWLGLYGPTHRLVSLRQTIGDALAEMEFPVSSEEFRPHITLGRVRNTGTPEAPLRALPDAVSALLKERGLDAPGAPSPAPLPVTTVELVRSHLSHAGARYETIATFPMASLDASPDRSSEPPSSLRPSLDSGAPTPTSDAPGNGDARQLGPL